MSYEILKKQVKNDSLQNMFHFFGEETYLKQHYLGILKGKIAGEFADFTLQEFEGDVTAQDIDVSFSTPPMMGDKKLIVFKDTGIFKNGYSNREVLKNAIENAPEFIYVIACEDHFDKRNAAFKAFSDKALSVDFKRRERSDIKAWVSNILGKNNKKMTAEAMEYFLDCVGVDMHSVHTDLQKLISYIGNRERIDKDDVSDVVAKDFFTKEYILTDALLAGDKKTAVKALEELIMMRNDPIMLLYIIASGYISTFKAKILLDENATSAEIMRALALPRDFLAKKYMDFARKLTLPKLKKAISLIKKADYDMKNGTGDSETVIKMLVAQL